MVGEAVSADVGVAVSNPRDPSVPDVGMDEGAGVGDNAGAAVSRPPDQALAAGATVVEGEGAIGGPSQRMQESQAISPSQIEVQSSVHKRHLSWEKGGGGQGGKNERLTWMLEHLAEKAAMKR